MGRSWSSHIIKKTNTPQSVFALNIRENTLTCPFPIFNENTFVLRDKCNLSSSSVTAVGVLLGLVVVATLMVVLFKHFGGRRFLSKCNKKSQVVPQPIQVVPPQLISESNASEKPKQIKAFSTATLKLLIISCFSMVDLITDVNMAFYMLAYINDSAETLCEPISKARTFRHFLPLDMYPHPDSTLPADLGIEGYVRLMEFKQIDDDYQGLVDQIGDLCTDAMCQFSESTLTCTEGEVIAMRAAELRSFETMVVFWLVILMCKEVAKVLIALYFTLRRIEIPRKIRTVLVTCFGLPLFPFLGYRARQVWHSQVAYNNSAFGWHDVLVPLIVDGLLENLPQLILGLVFANSITQTGLSFAIVASVTITSIHLGMYHSPCQKITHKHTRP